MLADSLRRTWFRTGPDRAARPALTLLCFPWAGAGTAGYQPFAAQLPATVALWRARLPGREDRIGEAPAEDFDALVRSLASAAQPATGGPYALFGHSFGGYLAAAVAAELHARGAPAPLVTFVSGARPPGAPGAAPPLSALDDTMLLATLARAGGVRSDLLDLPGLGELLLPVLRADLRMVEAQRDRIPAVLPGALTVFAGRDDPLAPPDGMASWRGCTSGRYRMKVFAGGHLFPLAQPGAVVAAVTEDLFAMGPAGGVRGADAPERR